jgi:hypothetical protein
MQHREFLVWIEGGFRRHQFEYGDAVERPAVPVGDEARLQLGFRQRDVESALALNGALQKELHRQGGLACPRCAFVQVDTLGIEPAAEDFIEIRTAGGDAWKLVVGR